MFASLLLIAGAGLTGSAGFVAVRANRLRRRVRRSSWLLTRVSAAIGEAERAGRVRAELADPP
ncbi:MAG: hypothetical protein ACJ72N_12155 [Labedaea sp.]